MKTMCVRVGWGIFLILGLAMNVHSACVEWKVSQGGNGHFYEAVYVPQGITWNDANVAARSKGGYLATVRSSAENTFCYNLVGSDSRYWGWGYGGCGAFIGGFQPDGSPEPGGNWQWVSGEAFSFTAWMGGEPNNSFSGGSYAENCLVYKPGGGWNDFPREVPLGGYVVEYDRRPEVYDAAADFGSTNPSGTWSYGYRLGGSQFQPSRYFGTLNMPGVGPVPFWYDGDYPYIAKNTDCSTNPYIPLGWVWLHTGGADAVLRWKAPSGGQYSVEYTFKMGSPGSVSCAVMQNNTILAQRTSGGNVPWQENLALNMSQHDTLDFVVNSAGDIGSDSTPLSVTIRPVGPQISNVLVTNITSASATVTWVTSEPTTSQVRYGSTTSLGLATEKDCTLTTTHSVSLAGLASGAVCHFAVVCANSSGSEVQSVIRSFRTLHTTDLAIQTADISFSPAAAGSGESARVIAEIRNSGTQGASGTVSFYNGHPSAGGTLISEHPGMSVPAGGATQVQSAPWCVGVEGTRSVYVVISNVSPTESNNSNNMAARELIVGAPANRLAVSVIPVTTWAGAAVDVSINIHNTGSQPATLTSVTIDGLLSMWIASSPSVSGVVLQPGESTTVVVTLNVPSNAQGGPIGGSPVVRSSNVTVGTTEQAFAGTLRVSLYSGPVCNVAVQVREQGTTTPLAGALVMVEGNPTTFVTDAGGNVTLDASPGSRRFFAYAENYIAVSEVRSLVTGNNSVSLDLPAGEVLKVESVEVQQLTPQQIQERGIELADPNNYTVQEFSINLAVVQGPDPVPPIPPIPVPMPINPTPDTHIEMPFQEIGDYYVGGQIDFIPVPPDPNEPNEPNEPNDPNIIPGPKPVPVVKWIIIPGYVKMLKQFFEATVVIHNMAVTDDPNSLMIAQSQATLTSLPTGLSLPDLHNEPQPLTKDLGDIRAGETKQAMWVIRGDSPGTYQIFAQATGTLQPFGVDIASSFKSATFPVIEPTMRLHFTVPDMVVRDVPFDLSIDLTNTSVIDLNEVSVGLHANQLRNCHLDPNESTEKAMGTVLKNQTKTVTFKVVPDISGIIIAADVTVNSPSITPNITITNAGDADLDGTVAFNDFLVFCQNFGKRGGFTEGDFSGDEQINFSDYLVLSTNFGMGGGVSPEEVEKFKAASANFFGTTEPAEVSSGGESGNSFPMDANLPCTPLATVILSLLAVCACALGWQRDTA